MKEGEMEAKRVLEKKGYCFDDKYYDDNSEENMPDFRLADGTYVEVTHTDHNHGAVKHISKTEMKPIEQQLKLLEKGQSASERLENLDYPMVDDISGILTEDGEKQHRADLKTVSKLFGYDGSGNHTEFGCDFPFVIYSSDNILQAIKKKAEKYADKISKGIVQDMDLFIFVAQEEYDSWHYLYEHRLYNAAYCDFCSSVHKSPFKHIFMCVWDLDEQTYNTEDPVFVELTGLAMISDVLTRSKEDLSKEIKDRVVIIGTCIEHMKSIAKYASSSDAFNDAFEIIYASLQSYVYIELFKLFDKGKDSKEYNIYALIGMIEDENNTYHKMLSECSADIEVIRNRRNRVFAHEIGEDPENVFKNSKFKDSGVDPVERLLRRITKICCAANEDLFPNTYISNVRCFDGWCYQATRLIKKREEEIADLVKADRRL